MNERVVLVATDDSRCRIVEGLLADKRTRVRAFPERPEPDAPLPLPWQGPAPDLLVVAAWGRTGQGAELVRAALEQEPNLSIVVLDEVLSWPEALRYCPGVAVVDGRSRAEFVAVRERLLERRALLAIVDSQRETPPDPLAAAALRGEGARVMETALLLQRALESDRNLILAGERGTLRGRLLRHLFAERGDLSGDRRTVLVEDLDLRSPADQADVVQLVKEGRRVLATATERFREHVADGRVRQDLYYLLGGTPIESVPLRERIDDVPALVEALGPAACSDSVLARMRGYVWPGNLRELELVVEHARMVARHRGRDGLVDDEDLMLPQPSTETLVEDAFFLHMPPTGIPLAHVEREAIRQTLKAAKSNVAETARRLEVDRGKLRYRLRRYGLGR